MGRLAEVRRGRAAHGEEGGWGWGDKGWGAGFGSEPLDAKY